MSLRRAKMSASSREVRYSQEFEIAQRTTEKAYPVAHSEWYRLIGRLKDCRAASRVFDAAGWTLLGVAVSSVLAGLALPAASTRRIVAFAVAGAALFGCWISLLYAGKHREDRETLLSSVIADMESFAQRFEIEQTLEIRSDFSKAIERALARLADEETAAEEPGSGSSLPPSARADDSTTHS